ncbi:AMP-binding protein [Actinomadura madurae]|uniref:AMP-binding protein n=1 Tax=Actinomadura madurae TaxID=1993 RepID=UPI003558D760
MTSRIPLRSRQTMIVEAPLFHTWGYAAMQMAWALRAPVVLHRRFDPEQTLRAVSSHRDVTVFAVPVMLQRVLELAPEVRGMYDTSSLRIAALSGAALPGDLATRFMDAFGDRLYNVYGSTEASWVSIATPRDLRLDPRTAGPPAAQHQAVDPGRPGPPARPLHPRPHLRRQRAAVRGLHRRRADGGPRRPAVHRRPRAHRPPRPAVRGRAQRRHGRVRR